MSTAFLEDIRCLAQDEEQMNERVENHWIVQEVRSVLDLHSPSI